MDKTVARAELVSLLNFGGGLTAAAGVLRLDCEPVAHGAAGRASTLIKRFYGIDATVRIGPVEHLHPIVRVLPEDVPLLATRLGLLTASGVPVVGLPPRIVAAGAANQAVAAAALRGAVLAAGRVDLTNNGALSLTVQCPGLAAAVALKAMARHVGATATLKDSDAKHRIVLRDRCGLGGALEAMGADGFVRSHIDPDAIRLRKVQAVRITPARCGCRPNGSVNGTDSFR